MNGGFNVPTCSKIQELSKAWTEPSRWKSKVAPLLKRRAAVHPGTRWNSLGNFMGFDWNPGNHDDDFFNDDLLGTF